MTCQNCLKREGTEIWLGTMSVYEAVRDIEGLPKWCELCVAEAQLSYARASAAKIPDLERKVAELFVAESQKL